jgi:hypothetical protein
VSAQADYQAASWALASHADASLAATLASLGDTPAFAAVVDVALPIVDAFGDAAGTLAADFYGMARAEAGVRGAYAAEPATSPTIDRVAGVTGWGMRTGADVPGQLALIRGGLVRAVTGTGRDTVRTSVARDRAAHGWRRVAGASACKFCRMLSGRGEVYRASTARFASHDHCQCIASPAFAPGLGVTVEQYTATQHTISDRDRARLREYLAA